jgi:hypothetical protein
MEVEMSVTPAPTHSIVKYQSPRARATQAAGNAALSLLVAVVIVAVPLLSAYLAAGVFTRQTAITLGTVVGTAVLGVILNYALKYAQANGDNTPPTVSADGTPPLAPPASAAIFAPPLTAESLRGLLETVDVLQEWARPPEPPPGTISHRIVTGTGEGVVLGTEAPVKRSHHAAKVPAAVAPLDVHSDS